MFDVDNPAFLTARQAVELLLGMGRESYRADIIGQESPRFSVSPLAGQQIETQLEDGICVGPSSRPALYHVAMVLTCLGRKIQAYCWISADDRGPTLVEACVYVDGQYVIKRKVSVKDGNLDPWGAPDDYMSSYP